jgi:hypothetical protein
MINAVLFRMSDPNVERGPERYFATCCVIVRQLDQQRRGLRQVGHSDRIGNGNTSWNSSHATTGCSQADLASWGGAGLFYCFA